MGIVSALAEVALGPLVEGACEALGGRLAEGVMAGVSALVAERFFDPSQRLARALEGAQVRAWKALELALAGDTFWERCQVRLARAEDRAFREQARAFLDGAGIVDGAESRRHCLDELRRARQGGLLNGFVPTGEKAVGAFGDPVKILDRTQSSLQEIADALAAAGFSHLARLAAPADGPSLLAVAVRHFFRRAVETDPELHRGLTFARLEAVSERQEQGLAALGQLLDDQAEKLDALLDEVQAQAARTHAAVLDVHQELLEQGMQNRALYQAVLDLQRRFDLMHAELRPRDSLSIQTDAERRLVREVVTRFRNLPEQQRRQLPALLNAIGKLEAAAGSFEAAGRDFAEVAELVPDTAVQGEAYHNAYRAALAKRDWLAARAALKEALARDPGRFAPFPLDRYRLRAVLGAGACGVALRCEDLRTGRPVTIKAVLPDALACGAEQLFAEARALQQLNHPGIAHLRDFGYADPETRTRPFIVMEHFEGQTLENHVRSQGPLAPGDWVPVARQVAEALQAAHAQKVLHRDVKPANLLVRPVADGLRIQLIDFGLALSQEAVRQTTRAAGTLAGAGLAGTLDYAAPEQLGRLPGVRVTPASDVYGFGKTCCFALFGTPQPLLKHWQQVPASVADLLGLCLNEAPDERPVDFEVVLKILDRVERSGVCPGVSQARPLAGTPRLQPAARPATRPAPEMPRPERPSAGSRPYMHLALGLIAAGLLILVLAIVLAVKLSGPTLQGSAPPAARAAVPPAATPAGLPAEWEPHAAAPPPNDLRPSANDPEALKVYLSDLKEFNVQQAPAAWRFGKHGYLGGPDPRDRIQVRDWVSYKGLSTHPTTTYGGASYRIAPAEWFETWVGVEPTKGAASGLELLFEVRGDDKVLWKSQPVRGAGAFQECRVSVKGVEVLELRVYAPAGSILAPHGGHAVWLDPYVTRPEPAPGK
jgi:serine/threonine protein kinase